MDIDKIVLGTMSFVLISLMIMALGCFYVIFSHEMSSEGCIKRSEQNAQILE